MWSLLIMIRLIIRILKFIFNRCDKCESDPHADEYICKKCKEPMSKINYSTGGIGVTDDYFSWSIKKDLDNPNSSLLKMINFEERLKKVKEQIAREKAEQESKNK